MLVIVLLQTAVFTWAIPREVNNFWHEARNNVPEFVAEFENERLLVEGLDQPYVLDDVEEDGESYFLYVDTLTTTTLAAEDLFPEDVDMGLLVTSKKVTVYQKSDSKYETVVFTDVFEEPWSLNNEDVVWWGDKIVTWIIWVVAPLITLFMFIFWSIGKLAYLAFAALIAWVIGRMGSKKWEYKEVYTVGLFAVTLPTLITLVLRSFGQPKPFVYTLVLVGLLVWAMYSGKERAGSVDESGVKEVSEHNKK